MTDRPPEYLAVHILTLQDGELRDDPREFLFLFFGPMSAFSQFLSFEVVPPSIPAVRSRSSYPLANLLPLLTEVSHSSA